MALRGMPLETLSLAGLPITSIEALRGMPLRQLDFFGCEKVTDFSPLTTLVRLETLNLPAHFAQLALVQKLRSLTRLGSGDFGAGIASFEKVPSVATFMGAYGQRLGLQSKLAPRLEHLRQRLRQAGARESQVAAVALGGDGLMDLDLTGVALDDLAALAGLPVRRLVIKATGISDLTPLRGMPLVALDASNTRVTDLTPLAACPSLSVLDLSQTSVTDLRALAALKLNRLALSGTAVQDVAPLLRMPLQALYFDGTKVEDLSPMARCTTMESITISRTALDPGPLRKLPVLLRISYAWDSENRQPAQSAAEFWAEYDATPNRREIDTKLNTALAKLRLLGGWTDERCEKQADGTYKFDLSELKLDHLSLLSDLPVSILNISKTEVTRLGPIATCPLRELYAKDCSIIDLAVLGRLPLERLEFTQSGPSDLRHLRGLKLRALIVYEKTGPSLNPDLSPLKGMPLEQFCAYGFSEISSLRPLEGAPISDLRIAGNPISDLKPLRKMPLTRLDLASTHVSDLSPLRNVRSRGSISSGPTSAMSLPWLTATPWRISSCRAPRRGSGKLRKLAKLKRIGFEWTSEDNKAPSLTAEEFWAEFDKQKKP